MLSCKLLCLVPILIVTQQVYGSTIAFVVDNTSSMRNNLNQVKDVVSKIADLYSELRFVDNYAIVKVAEPIHFTQTRISNDRYIFDVELNSLDGLSPGLNWDCMEPILYGVTEALTRSDPLSHLYVFVDSPAKDYLKSNDVIILCQEFKTQITFVVMGHCLDEPGEFWVYHDIARKCFGNVMVVSRDELRQIPDFLRETIRGCPRYLKRMKAPANRATDVEFTIENKTNYVVISASGFNVDVYLPIPKWRQEILIWTDNFKAIKILNPAITKHMVSVSGENIDIALDIIISNKDCCKNDDFSFEIPNEVTSKITSKTKSEDILEKSTRLALETTNKVTPEKTFEGNLEKMDESQIAIPTKVNSKTTIKGMPKNMIELTTTTPNNLTWIETLKRFLEKNPKLASEIQTKGNSGSTIARKNIELATKPMDVTSTMTYEGTLNKRIVSEISTEVNSKPTTEEILENNLIEAMQTPTKFNFELTTQGTSDNTPEWFLPFSYRGLKPPAVEISEGRRLEVPFNDSILLVCKVSAYPKPDIVWSDEERTLMAYETLLLYPPNLYISFLRLVGVTENGFYNCYANNTIGEDVKYIEVIVKDSPIILDWRAGGYSEDNVTLEDYQDFSEK